MKQTNSVTVYGIPNCDSVKKARTWLAEHQIDYVFHDFKKQGVPEDALDFWMTQVGWQVLVNTKGTTWRKLDESVRLLVTDNHHARELMLAHPSVIKRPVIVQGKDVWVGVNPAQWSNVLS